MFSFAGYDFKLSSLLIVDEFGEGFSVGWCLSSREDFSVLKIFFEKLTARCGHVNPNCFMSDIAPQFYDAFSSVFLCEPKRLYCTWHVDKIWQEQLRNKIKNFELESQVYKQLRIVLENTDETNFKNNLSTLRDRLYGNDMTKEFAEYFDIHYVPYTTRWGYARDGDGGDGRVSGTDQQSWCMSNCTILI